ncbi:MAG: hypothetical protein KGN00_01340 [Chloroflexota bacterium]|nr:hypothetical protein [Chloroflexota bacterium]MDE3192306.1 hypothetical protein [Chloroflexota bacterium]
MVIAHDPQIREGWARSLEATGMQVARCPGPSPTCPLVRGEDHCALLDESGLALYHEGVLGPDLVARLSAAHTSAMAVATKDRHRADGGHEPAMSHVIASPAP